MYVPCADAVSTGTDRAGTAAAGDRAAVAVRAVSTGSDAMMHSSSLRPSVPNILGTIEAFVSIEAFVAAVALVAPDVVKPLLKTLPTVHPMTQK